MMGGAAASVALSQRRTLGAKPEGSPPTHEETFALLNNDQRIPVIYDTDIGTDIDDTWGLFYLLKCPELSPLLVACDAGLGNYRAKIACKFLEACGSAHIPVAISTHGKEGFSHQQDWLNGYDLKSYPGEVHDDAADQIIKAIHASPDPVTLICVGAVPNIAEALRRDPTICNNARFVGMHGSIRVGYGGSSTPVAEANVRSNPAALRSTLAANWQCSITPLDTCGIINLEGERYQRIINSGAVGIDALMENYSAWLNRVDWLDVKPDPKLKSSTLFDLVAIYMAFSESLLAMETLKIEVTDDGMTQENANGASVRCAMKWNDLDAFKDHLVERLTS